MPRLLFIIFLNLLYLSFSPVFGSAGEPVITTSRIDVDNNNILDTVRIILKSGSLINDSNLWCNSGKKYEGLFDLEVLLDNGQTKRHSLNKLYHGKETDEMSLRAGGLYSGVSKDSPLIPWQLQFEDYNEDGLQDFTVGSYAGCNGWKYRIYTIGRFGEVTELQTDKPEGDLLYSSSHKNSLKLKKAPEGFIVEYYSNATGYFRDTYMWFDIGAGKGRFELVGRKRNP